MKKVKVILDFIRMAIGEKIAFYRNVITLMTGNPKFPKPDVELAELTTLVDTLESDYMASRSGSHLLIAKMKKSKEGADEAFRKLAMYVDRIANGDSSVILSAGFHVAKEREPSQRKDFKAESGANPGEVILTRKAIKGAKSYVWQYCIGLLPTDDQTWIYAGFSTKVTFEVKDLESGSKCWFRVAPITTDGMGSWSNPVMKVVP